MLKMSVKNRKKKQTAQFNEDESTTMTRTTATSLNTVRGSDEDVLQQKIAEINQILDKDKVWFGVRVIMINRSISIS